MATNPIQALDKMLQYQQQRDRDDFQESLQLMQFAQSSKMAEAQLSQQKRAADIQLFGQSLDLLRKENQQMKLSSASKFLQDSGLSAIYSKYKDEDNGLRKAVEELAGKEGWFKDTKTGVDERIAEDLILATWSSYEAQDPDSIIDIASRLHNLDDKKAVQSSYNKKLLSSFKAMNIFSSQYDLDEQLSNFKTMKDTIDNEMMVREEILQFTRGDFEIQKKFKFVDKVLNKIEIEGLTPRGLKPEAGDDMTGILPPDKVVAYHQNKVEDIEENISVKEEALLATKDAKANINFMLKHGMEVSEEQIASAGTPEAQSEIESQLSELNEKLRVAKLKTQKIKSDLNWEKSSELISPLTGFSRFK
tara:strand:+ start:23 stop:1108 length:1086 start_codon:yes stop_codon:yes gene_type:complete